MSDTISVVNKGYIWFKMLLGYIQKFDEKFCFKVTTCKIEKEVGK